MKLLKKIKAKFNKAPFFIDQYWQPFWVDFNRDKKLFKGFSPVIFDNNSKVGDEVKLLTNGKVEHFYAVKKIKRSSVATT